MLLELLLQFLISLKRLNEPTRSCRFYIAHYRVHGCVAPSTIVLYRVYYYSTGYVYTYTEFINGMSDSVN